MDRFAALGDPTRRAIVGLLSDADRRAGEIAMQFESSPPAISQHLKILRNAGLIKVEQRGRERIYSLDINGLAAIEHWAANARRTWTRRLDALERALEAEK